MNILDSIVLGFKRLFSSTDWESLYHQTIKRYDLAKAELDIANTKILELEQELEDLKQQDVH